MFSNRLHNYMKRILHNSKLNRVITIKNKNKYNIMNSKKNNNIIIKRYMSTTTSFKKDKYSGFTGGGGGPNSYFVVLVMAIGFYVVNRR